MPASPVDFRRELLRLLGIDCDNCARRYSCRKHRAVTDLILGFYVEARREARESEREAIALEQRMLKGGR